MKNIKAFLLLTCAILILSCNSENTATDTSDSIAVSDPNKGQSEILRINGENIPIRSGPGKAFDKLVNEKATEAIGETQYCEVDYSVKVEAMETKEDWTKIKVVEPEWLSDIYIGWIPSKYIISEKENEKQSLGKLNSSEFEIIKEKHNSAVQNFHVLLKHPGFDRNYVYQFSKQFRKEFCSSGCNVYLYDSKSILPLIDIYPLEGKDYIKLADHFISLSSFDAPEVRDWYPYQDFKYKEYGGKKLKK